MAETKEEIYQENAEAQTECVTEELLPATASHTAGPFKVVELKEGSACRETDSRETPEQDDRQLAAETQTDSRETPKQGDRQLAAETQTDTICPTAADTSDTQSKQWQPGAACRALFSEDGRVYPAAVVWVRGQRCRVRFDNYNNEEELDVSSLLSPYELNGPGKAAAAMLSRQKKAEKEKKRRGKVQSAAFSAFPPPPPPPLKSEGSTVFLTPPPPPPLWALGGQEPGGAADTDNTFLSNMLMLWYTCGFHTGSYMAQQMSRSSTKD